MRKFGKTFLLLVLVITISLTACDKKGEEKNELSGQSEVSDVSKEDGAIARKTPVHFKISDFEAETFSDEKFTKEDFAKYDLTMINVWASWCGPCIGEIPALQELKEMLPENMNIITINADAHESGDISREILEENNVTFDTLIPEEVLGLEILSNVQAYPTTIFVDRDGNVVGEQLRGVPASNVAEVYFEVMKETLEGLK